MRFRRKLDEMTMCAGVAPVTMAPMGMTLKKKRLQDPKKKLSKNNLKEINVSAEADKLVTRLLSEDDTTIWPPALDRIKLREPTKKPVVRPQPGFGAKLKAFGGKIGRKAGSFAAGLLDGPPYPTAPEDQQIPISPRAIDRINLLPDPEAPEHKPGLRINRTIKPNNPVMPTATGLKSKWTNSSTFGVQMPGPGHPALQGTGPAAKLDAKKQPWVRPKRKNSKIFKRPPGVKDKAFINNGSFGGLLPEPTRASRAFSST